MAAPSSLLPSLGFTLFALAGHGFNLWVLKKSTMGGFVCCVLVLGVLQKSLAGALVSALLGVPVFLVLLAGGMFFC
jgi:hypothetical protein